MIKKLFVSTFVVSLSLYVNCQCSSTGNLTTTYSHNNGQDGIMFDVFALNDVIISCFDMNFDPGTFNYEVYYKSGTAQGFQTNSGAWTLVGSGTGITSAGNGNPTAISINIGVGICSGSVASFYITNTGGSQANANYTNGTSLNNVFAADANIQVREMYGKAYPFSSSYSPRVFNGSVYYNGGSCSVLPVELLDFQATVVDRKVDLAWQTASEKDNDYFEIHRSVDMEQWEFVARIDGAGNNEGLLNYSTEDFFPKDGISYYRLTQFDFDGESSSGGIKSVFLDSSTDDLLSVSPNPAKGILRVVGDEGLEDIVMLNSMGQQVKMNILVKSIDHLTIDVSDLSSGVYFLRSNGNTYKVIKE
ncbi:MAG: T9SS type A sorting domain-containing protein [Crocinitomicaceae bacterium]|nr:T9SS type A sorting domain-containing protein [Crocinitomicaceae bacterium]